MRTIPSVLADVLFGQTRGGILGLLYGRSSESFYVRQIARRVGVSVGAVQRELETLSQGGLIVRSSVGNQVFYRANRNSPVFPEMHGLVAKTIGVIHGLRSALEPISDQIVVAFVYGSMARQEDKAESDIDVMIVGKVGLEDIIERLSEVQVTLARPVNPTVYSLAEFKAKISRGNHFVNAVIRGDKIFLVGDQDELRKVGGVRMAEARTHQSR